MDPRLKQLSPLYTHRSRCAYLHWGESNELLSLFAHGSVTLIGLKDPAELGLYPSFLCVKGAGEQQR